MRKKISPSTIVPLLLFVAGFSILLYPAVSDWWNSFHQSHAIANYDTALTELAPEDYSAYFAAAEDYNSRLAQTEIPLVCYDQVSGYNDILNVAQSGIMGYIDIPEIDVSLPIYHGTSDTVLKNAVGHLEGSSVPTGGENTHCVLSGHRGLPSAKLFTDLDKLEIGDTFTVTVLDRLLTYEIDQVLIVEPTDVKALGVVEGEDLCTLVTCTPYGINTHRLLVRGHRIENTQPSVVRSVSADAVQIDPSIVSPFVAAPALLVLLIAVFLPKPKRESEAYN